MLHFLLRVFCLSEAEVEKHLQDTSGKEGQSCTLSCQLSIPNVEAQWFKNGQQLEMKGRYTSEVKHKVQKLLIRDLKREDQGRYTCRYQHLESSADLWVEGLYLEIILQPSRRCGCFFPFTNLFQLPHQTLMTNVGDLDFALFFVSFFWDLSPSVLTFFPPLLFWIILPKMSAIISFVVFFCPSRLKSTPTPPTTSHHKTP